MALPLLGFIGLLLLAIILFFIGFGKTEQNVNVGFAFIVLASIILFATSMFIMNDGLMLDVQNGINPDTGVIDWMVVLYDVNSWNWLRVITDVIFYGAFVGLIMGAWKAYNTSKSKQNNEWTLD
jgi:nitric oxide reductase large subunit